MPSVSDQNTAADGDDIPHQANWDVSTSRRKRALRVAAQHTSATTWQRVQRHCSHLLTVAAKLGCQKDCLLEALIFEAVATTPNFEAFSATPPSADKRYLNELVFATSAGDVETFLNVMRGWTDPANRRQKGARGATLWCQQNGINQGALKVVEKKVQNSYAQLQQLAPRQFLPKLQFSEESKEASVGLVIDIVSRALAHSICVYTGDKSLGYVEMTSGDTVPISDLSVVNFLSEPPRFVAFVDSPSMTSAKRHLVVVPEKEAKVMIEQITGERAEEAIDRLVPQSVVIPKIGRSLLKKLKYHWELEDSGDHSLKKRLQTVCDDRPCALKLDLGHGAIKVTCLAEYHQTVRAILEEYVEKERTEMRKESLVVNYPFPCSKLCLAVNSGATCRSPMGEADFISLAVRYSSGDISMSDITDALADFDVTVEQKDSPKTQGGILGVATFQSTKDAARAHGEVYSDKFMLDPHCSKGFSKSSAQLEQSVAIDVAWIKPAGPVTTDIHQFKTGLEESLKDLPVGKLRCSVFLRHDAAHPYGARVTTTDCTTAMRALSFLQVATVCGQRLHICNLDDVQSQLRSFTIDLDVRVYTAIKDVLWSRLANFMRQPTNKMECKEVDGEKGRCKLIVRCADAYIAKHVMDRLQDTVMPKKFNNKQNYSVVKLLPEDLNVILQKIMTESKAYIELDELRGQLYVYGSKTTRQAAGKLLKTHVLYGRHWFITRLFDEQYVPDALMQLMHQTNQEDITAKFKVDGLEIHPKEGYILHRTNRHWMETVHSKNVRNGLQFLEKKPSPPEVECVACFTATLPNQVYILEGCGHSYCLGCLQSQLKTSQDNTIYPLNCACCDSPFVIQDLFNICGPLKLYNLATILKGSLRSFINCNVKQYRCCPHLSCEGVVDITCTDELSCSLCSRRVCEDCHEMQHEEYTCEEFRNTKKILVDWIKENPKDRKQCPSCEIGIEKVEGCDNVLCTACRRHVCWMCMAHFADADDCYDHLDDEHDGV